VNTGYWNTVIASIGAITGITALVWNILRDKIGGKIGLYHAITIYDKEYTEESACVEFINKGKHNIKLMGIGFQSGLGVKGFLTRILKLDKIGFQSPRGTKGFLNAGEFGLPKWVVPNDSVSFVFAQQHIANMKNKSKEETNKLKYIYVRDATNKHYYIKISNSIRKVLFG